jgi:two-component system phosphate regulon response regulator OmpR
MCPWARPETFAYKQAGGATPVHLHSVCVPRDSGRMDNATPSPNLLLVDDDPRLRDLLQRYLEGQGFAVKGVGDGAQMQQALDRGHFDLIVLDLMLPGESGLDICRRLRGQGDATPVVMLTAKGDEIDRIVGLEIGADDYLPKPVNPRELLARIRAVLRRSAPAVPGAPAADGGELRFGPFSLDLGRRELRRGDVELKITGGEFAILSVLLRHPRQPLSRDRLMSLARGRGHDAFERSIDVAVARLRKLLEDDPRQPRMLQTVWGVGYVFVPPGAPA